MHICLPPCAITSETGIVCRCNASTRPAVPEETILHVSSWFSLSSSLLPLSFSFSIYIFISIRHGVLFIVASVCSCKRFARDIQSMTTYALRSGLATSDPHVNAVRIFIDYIAYHILCNLKNRVLRCTKRMRRNTVQINSSIFRRHKLSTFKNENPFREPHKQLVEAS